MSQWDRLQQIRELRDRSLSVQELARRLHMACADVQQALAELKRRYP
jgi:Mn-dependent DtxR family transcriptional regulator